jgi:general secretion pathway protein I
MNPVIKRVVLDKRGVRLAPCRAGFTLLEVLIALAVIGLVLPPLLINAAERLNGLKNMEEKIVANLVAQNQLSLYRLNNRIAGKRPPRREDGNELMAGRDWFWEAETEPTEVEGYFRIDIIVASTRDLADPRARVSAYLGVE